MGSILIVYASQTGSTEVITDIVADHLEELGHQVVIKSLDFDTIDMDKVSEYDAVLVGTYTSGDGELPYEVEFFYDDLEDIDITGLLFGVYGSADSCYDTYGQAIDLVADQAENLGAQLIEERLKIDLMPGREDEKRLAHFSSIISEKIKENKKALA